MLFRVNDITCVETQDLVSTGVNILASKVLQQFVKCRAQLVLNDHSDGVVQVFGVRR